jgi:hypothetical protein
MQSQMITTLHVLLVGGFTNYDELLGISESSRVRAILALEGQFQRMLVSAPLGNAPAIFSQPLSPPWDARKGSYYLPAPFTFSTTQKDDYYTPLYQLSEHFHSSPPSPPTSLANGQYHSAQTASSTTSQSLYGGLLPASIHVFKGIILSASASDPPVAKRTVLPAYSWESPIPERRVLFPAVDQYRILHSNASCSTLRFWDL